jgi:hypothetical protein
LYILIQFKVKKFTINVNVQCTFTLIVNMFIIGRPKS